MITNYLIVNKKYTKPLESTEIVINFLQDIFKKSNHSMVL